MSDFFSFILVMFKDLVSLFFDLPFMASFSYGDLLVAIVILAVVSSALIGQLRSFNLSHEASTARANARSASRPVYKGGKQWKR